MGKLAAAQEVRDDVIAALTAIADLMEPPPLMMVDPDQTLNMVPGPPPLMMVDPPDAKYGAGA